MANLSHLSGLASSEPLDLSIYEDAKSGFELPKAGRYIVRAPETFPQEAYSATREGQLAVQVDPTIVGPTNEGFQIRFTRLSAKPFQRGGKTVSMIGDYLRAHGFTNAVPGDPDGIAAEIERTAGQAYEVYLDWEARNSATGFKVKGMKNFPPDGNGGHQPWVEDPNDTDPATGAPKRLRANIIVSRFVAPSA